MQSQEIEDSFLIGQISAGDQEAFARFYDLHSAAVLGLVARVLGAGGEAEEVLQEVFLQVWRQSDRYEAARSTPRGWLLMLARSRALDRLRRRAAPGRHAKEAVADAPVPRPGSPVRARALARLRRRDARGRHEKEAVADASFPRLVSPLGTRRLEDVARRERICSALNLLSPEQRRCIELAFFEGLTHT